MGTSEEISRRYPKTSSWMPAWYLPVRSTPAMRVRIFDPVWQCPYLERRGHKAGINYYSTATFSVVAKAF
jgi:hypothetical protein